MLNVNKLASHSGIENNWSKTILLHLKIAKLGGQTFPIAHYRTL